MRVATFLESHPRVRRVSYPGLASHPQYALAGRQMECFSGLLAAQIDEADSLRRALTARARLWQYAVSFGHARSVLYYLSTAAMQRSLRLSPAQLSQYRIFASDGVFRLSVGLEHPDDLCEDLARLPLLSDELHGAPDSGRSVGASAWVEIPWDAGDQRL
jgi:methionine-gamma-lyase